MKGVVVEYSSVAENKITDNAIETVSKLNRIGVPTDVFEGNFVAIDRTGKILATQKSSKKVNGKTVIIGGETYPDIVLINNKAVNEEGRRYYIKSNFSDFHEVTKEKYEEYAKHVYDGVMTGPEKHSGRQTD